MKKISKGLYQILESNLQSARESKPFGLIEGKLIQTVKSRKFTTYTLETGIKHPRIFENSLDKVFWEKGIFYIKLKQWFTGNLKLSSFFYSNVVSSSKQKYLSSILLSRQPKAGILDFYLGPENLFFNGKKFISTHSKLYLNLKFLKGIFVGTKRVFLKGRYIPYRPYYISYYVSKSRSTSLDSPLFRVKNGYIFEKPYKIRFKPPYLFNIFFGGTLHQIPLKTFGAIRRKFLRYRSFSEQKWPYKRFDFFLLWSCLKCIKQVVFQLNFCLTCLNVNSNKKKKVTLYKKYLFFLFSKLVNPIILMLKGYKRRIIPLYWYFLFVILGSIPEGVLNSVYGSKSLITLKKEKNFQKIVLNSGFVYKGMLKSSSYSNKNVYLFFLMLSSYRFVVLKKSNLLRNIFLEQEFISYRSTPVHSFFNKKNRFVQLFKLYNRREAYVCYRGKEVKGSRGYRKYRRKINVC